MELKNTSEKVISIGDKIVMPDNVIEITEEQAAMPSIKALIGQGYVSVTRQDSAASTEKQAKDTPAPTGAPNADGDKPDSGKTEDIPANADVSPAEADTGDDKSTASKRGKNK